MSRSIPPSARPHCRARRLLAPIVSLAACAGAASALVVVTTVAAPAASAAVAVPDIHHSHTVFPTLPISTFTLPIIGSPTTATSSSAPTSAPATSQTSSQATQSTAGGGSGGGHHPRQTSTFVPQSLPAQAAPTSAGPCVPDTKAPQSGADLQLPQVNAGSTDAGYTGWLRLSAVGPQSMVPTQIDSSDLSTLTLTRTADAESPNLSMAASSGDRFACARLDVAAGPGYQRLDYALTNAGIVSETMKGKTETLIVTYSSISWNYLPTGSKTPKTGSGAINTQPNVASTSLKHDAVLVGAGVVALTVVCLLGMLLLTLIGRHRRKLRYREVRRRSRHPAVPAPTAAAAATLASAKLPALVPAGPAPLPDADPNPALPEIAVPEALQAVHISEFTHPHPPKPTPKPTPAPEPAAEAVVPAAAEADAEGAPADAEDDGGVAESDSGGDSGGEDDEAVEPEPEPMPAPTPTPTPAPETSEAVGESDEKEDEDSVSAES